MTLPASGAISFSNIDTELGYSATAQIGLNCSAVRTLFGQASGAICMNTGHGKSNTSVPGAPTGVSASATSYNSASVSFSAPSCTGHLSIDYYQAISSPGCFTATGSSPISITGLTPNTSYTFKVRAHNSKGYGCYSSSSGSITTPQPTGSTTLTTVGNYSWNTPSIVSTYGLKLSIVVIGGGSGGSSSCRYFCCCSGYVSLGGSAGAGGGLQYRNNVPYTNYSSGRYNISDGASPHNSGKPYVNNCNYAPCNTWFGQNSTGGIGVSIYGNPIFCGCQSGCSGVGGAGGSTFGAYVGGGGGAGGYSGRGGFGARNGKASCPTGGAGGGGGSGYAGCSGGAGGGGVGLYGQGSNGTSKGYFGGGGCGGSGGSNGSNYSGQTGGNGGNYGGGGAGGASFSSNDGGHGAQGAIRVVWPGCSRRFPSTCVGSP